MLNKFYALTINETYIGKVFADGVDEMLFYPEITDKEKQSMPVIELLQEIRSEIWFRNYFISTMHSFEEHPERLRLKREVHPLLTATSTGAVLVHNDCLDYILKVQNYPTGKISVKAKNSFPEILLGTFDIISFEPGGKEDKCTNIIELESIILDLLHIKNPNFLEDKINSVQNKFTAIMSSLDTSFYSERKI